MGGLGNQMFQIAKATSEGLYKNISAEFLKTSAITTEGNPPTKYLNNIFRNVNFVDSLPETVRVSEFDWAYRKQNINGNASVEFFGYFQSSKNFNEHGEYLKNIFSPTSGFLDKIEQLYPNFKNEKKISIHVRRGDYLSILDFLPVIDKSYIDQCLKYTIVYDKIYIFSDDKEWCKQNLNYKNSEVVCGLEDYEELWMMSLCNTNIMSNSSFSWWGSYLNKNKGKRVFCPSIWFGPQGPRYWEDVYENDWNRINVKFKNGFLCC
jgi:hypothetical protein